MSTSKYTRTNSTYKKHNLELPKIRQMIDEYNNGCLTQAQICAKYNIPLSTFSYYKNSSKNTRGKVQPSPEDYEICTSERAPVRTSAMPQRTQQYTGSQPHTEVKQPTKTIEVTYNEHPRTRHSGQVYESVDIVPCRPSADTLEFATMSQTVPLHQEHSQPRKKVERLTVDHLDKMFHLDGK